MEYTDRLINNIEACFGIAPSAVEGSDDKLKKACEAYGREADARFAAEKKQRTAEITEKNRILDEDIAFLKKLMKAGTAETRKTHAHAVGSERPDLKKLYDDYLYFGNADFSRGGQGIMERRKYEKLMKRLSDFYSACERGITWCEEKKKELKLRLANENKAAAEELKAEKNGNAARLEAMRAAEYMNAASSSGCNLREFFGGLESEHARYGLSGAQWNSFISPFYEAEGICPGTAAVPSGFDKRGTYRGVEISPLLSAKGDISVPLCIPFSENTVIEYTSETRSKVIKCIQGTIMRLVRTMPHDSFTLTVIDPDGRGKSLGELIKLTRTEPHCCPLCSVPASTEPEIKTQLGQISDIIGKNSKKLAELGINASVDDFNARGGEYMRRHIVMIEDFGEGMDSSFLGALRSVSTENAKKCGVTVILAADRDKLKGSGLSDFYESFVERSRYIYESAGGKGERKGSFYYRRDYKGECLKLPVKLADMKGIPDTYIDSVYNAYVNKTEADTSPERFYGKRTLPALRDASKPLMIPFAVNGATNETAELELGGDSTSFAMLTGTQGSGKTSLLHAIITGLMANYHPDDVELWLVDYKKSEFKIYSNFIKDGKRLPHVSFIGTDDAPGFTYALLDRLKAEFERRGEIFTNSASMRNISEYIAKRNRQKAEKRSVLLPSMPRIVLVIDEMSTFAKHLDMAPEYAELFEHAIRFYRAWGLCAVLADQNPIAASRGISDNTQGLIMTRLAMKHQLDSMKETLQLPSYPDELITAMSEMSSGDVIYKHSVPEDKFNTVSVTAKYRCVYLKENDERRDISDIVQRVAKRFPEGSFEKKSLAVVAAADRKRVTRNAEAVAEYNEKHPVKAGCTPVVPGISAGFPQCFRFELARRRQNNMLVISPDTSLVSGTVKNTVLSFTENGGKAVILLNTASALYCECENEFRLLAESDPLVTVIDSPEDACVYLNGEAKNLRNRSANEKTLIVLAGAEEWYEDFAFSADEYISAPGPADVSRPESVSDEAAQLDELIRLGFLEDDGDEEDAPGIAANESSICLDCRDAAETLLKNASRFGEYVMYTVERAASLEEMNVSRECFCHTVAGNLSRDDIYYTSVPRDSFDVFRDKKTADSELIYHDGKSQPVYFLPFF